MPDHLIAILPLVPDISVPAGVVLLFLLFRKAVKDEFAVEQPLGDLDTFYEGRVIKVVLLAVPGEAAQRGIFGRREPLGDLDLRLCRERRPGDGEFSDRREHRVPVGERKAAAERCSW